MKLAPSAHGTCVSSYKYDSISLPLPLRLDRLAHEVALEERRRTRRASVSDRDEVVVTGGDPQHDVGECEVGEELPVTDEEVEPFNVGVVGTALGENEV